MLLDLGLQSGEVIKRSLTGEVSVGAAVPASLCMLYAFLYANNGNKVSDSFSMCCFICLLWVVENAKYHLVISTNISTTEGEFLSAVSNKLSNMIL